MRVRDAFVRRTLNNVLFKYGTTQNVELIMYFDVLNLLGFTLIQYTTHFFVLQPSINLEKDPPFVPTKKILQEVTVKDTTNPTLSTVQGTVH